MEGRPPEHSSASGVTKNGARACALAYSNAFPAYLIRKTPLIRPGAAPPAGLRRSSANRLEQCHQRGYSNRRYLFNPNWVPTYHPSGTNP